VLGNEWVDDSNWGRSFVGDIGIACERLDVPLEAKRGRLEGFIVLSCHEQVESEGKPDVSLPF
jgi:hypothetical protein